MTRQDLRRPVGDRHGQGRPTRGRRTCTTWSTTSGRCRSTATSAWSGRPRSTRSSRSSCSPTGVWSGRGRARARGVRRGAVPGPADRLRLALGIEELERRPVRCRGASSAVELSRRRVARVRPRATYVPRGAPPRGSDRWAAAVTEPAGEDGPSPAERSRMWRGRDVAARHHGRSCSVELGAVARGGGDPLGRCGAQHLSARGVSGRPEHRRARRSPRRAGPADHERGQEAEHVAVGAAGQGEHAGLVAAGADPAGGRGSGSVVPGSTISMAIIAPRPRTSPIAGCRRPGRASRPTSSASIVAGPAVQVELLHRRDRAQGGGAGHRVAAVGAAEAAGVHRVHHLGAADDAGQRQAAGDALGRP